jgi:peptidoglycan/xylan/chitin deacetylase (PgdA/CDA1 family)
VLCLPAAAHAETAVSLTFDDGAVSQLFAKDQMLAHRIRGTFYIISGAVGSNSYYMTWSDIAGLAAAGDEVGGHTLNHMVLTTLPPAQATIQVCQDRQNLIAHGYTPVSFAYPTGANNPAVEGIVKNCGYATARRVGGLTHAQCGTCIDAETIPPGDPYTVRSNDAHAGPLSLPELQKYVLQAVAAGGGWVPLTFHDVCSPCAPTAVDESITPAAFVAFLDWLGTQGSNGVVVKSMRAVMGFAEPPLPPLPAAPPAVTLLSRPTDKTTAFASLKVRKRQRAGNLSVSASMAELGTLSADGTVTLGKRYRLKKVKAPAAARQVVTLRPALTKKGLRAVRRALKRHRRVQAVISVVAKDAAGNVKSAIRTIRLR